MMLEIILLFYCALFLPNTSATLSALLPPSPLSLATGLTAGNANSIHGERASGNPSLTEAFGKN